MPLPRGVTGSWPELLTRTPGARAKAGLAGLKARGRGWQRQDPAAQAGDALQDLGSHSDFRAPRRAATAQELVSSHRNGHSKSRGLRESGGVPGALA